MGDVEEAERLDVLIGEIRSANVTNWIERLAREGVGEAVEIGDELPREIKETCLGARYHHFHDRRILDIRGPARTDHHQQE
jgi:hypothetical protein